jgi:hypothetical protein
MATESARPVRRLYVHDMLARQDNPPAFSEDPLPHQTTEADRAVMLYLRSARMLEPSKTEGFHYSGPCDFLIQHARFWTVQSYPSNLRPMVPQQCFDNAYRMARKYGWRYVEGYALGILPVHHAWVVDHDDRVIDPTWATISRKIRTEAKPFGGIGTSYCGVSIPLDVVRDYRIVSDRSMLCSVLACWQKDYAIYREPFRME